MPQRRVGEIVAGTRGVTADTGLRLSRFFGMSDGFWTGLQMDHDAAQTKDVLAKTLAKITPWTDRRVAAQQQVRMDTLVSASIRQGRRRP